MNKAVVLGFVIGSGITVVVLVALLVVSMIRVGTRLVRMSGDDLLVRGLSIGLASALFPDSLWKAIAFFTSLFGVVQRSIRSGASSMLESVSNGDCVGAQCDRLLERDSLMVLNQLTMNLSQTFDTLPRVLTSMIPWLCTVVISSRLLHPGKDDSSTSLSSWYAGLTPTKRKNAFFFALLGVGVYFSIASIVAVSSLRIEALPQELGSERLQTQASISQLSDEDFDRRFPMDPSGSPFTSLIAELTRQRGLPLASVSPPPSDDAAASGSLPAPSGSPASPPQPTGVAPTPDAGASVAEASTSPRGSTRAVETRSPDFDLFAQDLDNQKKFRELLISNWVSLRNQAKGDLGQIPRRAVSKFTSSNAHRVGSRESARHFQQLEEWSLEESRQLQDVLVQCMASIQQADLSWSLWSNAASSILRNPHDPNYQNGDYSDPNLMPNSLYACSLRQDRSIPPDRPRLGENMGPFGLVAGWLVATESIDLTLIVGLLGLGLLGSAGSAAIRRRGVRRASEPLVEDLEGVMIRGVSAALVVFLSVCGGIAAFSTSESSPNPYVLMFTCLLASVYSEDVWDWARGRLHAGLNGAPRVESEDPEEATRETSDSPATEKAGE